MKIRSFVCLTVAGLLLTAGMLMGTIGGSASSLTTAITVGQTIDFDHHAVLPVLALEDLAEHALPANAVSTAKAVAGVNTETSCVLRTDSQGGRVKSAAWLMVAPASRYAARA